MDQEGIDGLLFGVKFGEVFGLLLEFAVFDLQLIYFCKELLYLNVILCWGELEGLVEW